MLRLLAAVAAAGGATLLAKELGVFGPGSGVSPAGPVGTNSVLIPRGLLRNKILMEKIPRSFFSGIVLRTVPLQRLAVWSQECGRNKYVKPFWASRENTLTSGDGESPLPQVWDTDQRPGPSAWAMSSEVLKARAETLATGKIPEALGFFELYGRTVEPFKSCAIGHGGDDYMQSLLAEYVSAMTETASHHHSAQVKPWYLNRTELWQDITDTLADIPLIGDILTSTTETGGTHGRWGVWGDDLGLLCFPPSKFASRAHYKAWLAHQIHFFNGGTSVWKTTWRYISRYSDVPAAEILLKSTANKDRLYGAGRAKGYDEDRAAQPGVMLYNWIQLCACLSFYGLIESSGNLTAGWPYKDPWASWIKGVGGKKPPEKKKKGSIGSAASKMLAVGLGTTAHALAGNYAGAAATFAGGAMATVLKSYAANEKAWWHSDWEPVAYDASKIGSSASLSYPPDYALPAEVRAGCVVHAATASVQSLAELQGKVTPKAPVVYMVQGYG